MFCFEIQTYSKFSQLIAQWITCCKDDDLCLNQIQCRFTFLNIQMLVNRGIYYKVKANCKLKTPTFVSL